MMAGFNPVNGNCMLEREREIFVEDRVLSVLFTLVPQHPFNSLTSKTESDVYHGGAELYAVGEEEEDTNEKQ